MIFCCGDVLKSPHVLITSVVTSSGDDVPMKSYHEAVMSKGDVALRCVQSNGRVK